MTGRGGRFGLDSIVAISMALEEIAEQKGDIPPPKINVIIEDSKIQTLKGAPTGTALYTQEKGRFSMRSCQLKGSLCNI